MNRVWRKVIALVGIAVIAFAQLTLSAYACPYPAGMGGSSAASMTVPCDQADPALPALCEKHCQDEQQKPNDASASSPAPAFVPAFSIHLEIDPSGAQGPSWASPKLLQAKPPSIAIRNCCFRI